MLLIAIPAVWLAVVAFFVLLCRMTARSEKRLAASSKRGRPAPDFPGLILFDTRFSARDERLGRGRASISTAGRTVRSL